VDEGRGWDCTGAAGVVVPVAERMAGVDGETGDRAGDEKVETVPAGDLPGEVPTVATVAPEVEGGLTETEDVGLVTVLGSDTPPMADREDEGMIAGGAVVEGAD